MKRELKHPPGIQVRKHCVDIAKPIPMKRELKHDGSMRSVAMGGYCKAYPDEKGIETEGRA